MGLIAIGDVHGCVRTLEVLLDRLQPAPDDHLVFIGDYIDRGPDSKGVIDLLLDLREEHRCTFLRGNHEVFMLDYVDRGSFELWGVNGGLATLESYSENQRIQFPDAHVAFLRETQLYLDTPEFFFVHAGLRANLTIAENLDRMDERVMLWGRDHLQASSVVWEKPVVFGHTPQERPINEPRQIGIDTGCVYYAYHNLGRLTAVRLPERVFEIVDYAG